MNIPRPDVAEFRTLVVRFAAAGWLQDGTMQDVLDTGSFSLALSAKGEAQLRTLYPILVTELDAPTAQELSALVWFLNDCAEKMRRKGRNPDP